MTEEENNPEEPQDDLAKAYEGFEKDLQEKEEDKVKWDESESAKDESSYEPVGDMNETFGSESSEETGSTEEREVPRSTTFDSDPSSVDSIMREALASQDQIEVTEKDKIAYLKAVLNDKPVILDVNLCMGKLSVDIRSRTAWEQTCLYAAVKEDQDKGIVTDLASVIIQLQKYGCALMVQSVNNTPFSTLELNIEDGLEACITKLRDQKNKTVEVLSIPKWSLMLNALRVYETKLSQLGTECLNENFWEPVG